MARGGYLALLFLVWCALSTAYELDLLSSVPEGTQNEAIVTIEGGQIVGVVNETARVFLGIPYGAPPVGAMRLRPPEPRQPWYAVQCVQSS